MTSPFPTHYERSDSMWAQGLALFAGIMLILVGVLQFLVGLAAVLGDDVFVVTRNYVFEFDLTTWGWICLVIGAVAALIGTGIVLEQNLAYVLGMIAAIISTLASFLFLPHSPGWAIVLIVFNVAVIWALASMIPRRV